MSKKEHTIENVLDELKPNTYQDGNVQWERLERGLNRMPHESISALWTLMLGKRERDRKISRKDLPKTTTVDYLYVRAWCQVLGSFEYFTQGQLVLARNEQAPDNAIYKDAATGDWKTYDDIENDDLRNEIDKVIDQI